MTSTRESTWRRSLRIAIGLAILVAVVVGVFHLTGRSPSVRTDGASAVAVPVTAAVAGKSDIPDIINAIGTVQSIDGVAVQPRVSGEIERIEFTPGTDVKKGQELFLIDPRPYQATLDQALGQLAKDQALLREAQLDLARYDRLKKQEAIAAQQAEDQVYVVEQDEGAVQLDQANVEAARLNLSYCHIAAPISGRAGALLADLGNTVGPQSGGQAASGSAASPTAAGAQAATSNILVSITQLQPIYVSFNVPQTRLGEIRRNQSQSPLELDVYSQAGKLLGKGKVSLIDNQVNMSTGTVLLQGTFANTDESLWPGEFVTVKLIVAMWRNIITVPATAVMAGASGFYVYVIGPDNTVKRADVVVAARQSGIAVIAKGVSDGQTVVTNGQYRLTDGVKVVVQRTGAAQPQTAAD